MKQLVVNGIIGKRINEIRREKGLRRKEVAIKIELSNAELAQIESGVLTPDLKTLCRLADILEISITELTWLD